MPSVRIDQCCSNGCKEQQKRRKNGSQVPPGQNLHRVVIYRDDASLARQTVPATTYPPQGSTDPEYLWKLLQAYEDKTGGDVLAIAHNGNLSNGLMFPVINPVDGR